VNDTLAPLSTRVITPADEPALRTIYRSTRVDEFAGLGWPDATLDAFCDQQFDAQQAHYRSVYADAEHHAVLDENGTVVGQVMIDRGPTSHTIVDIALLPDHRRRGRGTKLLSTAIAAADRLGLPVQLTVARNNPAQALYRRLGFESISTTELHLHMRRPATGKDPE
jgi:ribosomal protein S18 acetylase RimI-like enzyme